MTPAGTSESIPIKSNKSQGAALNGTDGTRRNTSGTDKGLILCFQMINSGTESGTMTERNGTYRSASAGYARPAAGGFFSSETQGSAKRSLGGFGGKPPLGGGFPPNPPPIEDRAKRDAAAAWLKANLPGIAAVATEYRAEFGDVRLVWAREAGHEIGKASGG